MCHLCQGEILLLDDAPVYLCFGVSVCSSFLNTQVDNTLENIHRPSVHKCFPCLAGVGCDWNVQSIFFISNWAEDIKYAWLTMLLSR